MHPVGRAPLRARLRDLLEVVNTPFRFVQDGLRFPASERRYRTRIDDSFRRLPEPMIVYSSMKTATTAVASPLSASGAFTVLKVHNIRPEHQYGGAGSRLVSDRGVVLHRAIEQRHAREYLSRHGGPVRVISLVRDPIAYNISNFTYFGRAYWLRTCWRSAPWMSADELWSRFRRTLPLHAQDAWWRHEYSPTMGWDPLEEPFDAERGWSIRSVGRFEAMIMRADLPDSEKTGALRSWLPGVAIAEVVRENENDTQAPPVLAERLRERVRSCPEYVDRALALPMTQRFWTPRQREAMRERWLGR